MRVYGRFEDYEGPIGGGSGIFDMVRKANPVEFPAFYPAEMNPSANHILFGNKVVYGSTNTLYLNPYANMVSGYQRSNTSTINAQVEIKQDFGFRVPGLSVRGMCNAMQVLHQPADIFRFTIRRSMWMAI